MSRCQKHQPEPRSDNPLDLIAGLVRCKNCGMEGRFSNGRREIGKPRRVIWFRGSGKNPAVPENLGGAEMNWLHPCSERWCSGQNLRFVGMSIQCLDCPDREGGDGQ